MVATLGVPDLLAGGPRSSEDLAQATGMHAGALYRVLRFLSGVGLFDEVAPHCFGLTALGSGLRSDVAGSLRATALMHTDGSKWEPWGHLLDSVRTGHTAFEQVHGMDVFAHMDHDPVTARIFQQAMTSNTARSGAALTSVYDLTRAACVVDVGGGQGLLLATILQAYPTMRGVLFDRPGVLAGAQALLVEAGVAERCELIGGDFFAGVPSGGEVYLLRQILHDWDDARATRILANIRQALGGRAGSVLAIEAAIASDYRQALPVLQLDLEMLVNYGGLQRTEAE